jgi:hypothetical protein
VWDDRTMTRAAVQTLKGVRRILDAENERVYHKVRHSTVRCGLCVRADVRVRAVAQCALAVGARPLAHAERVCT